MEGKIETCNVKVETIEILNSILKINSVKKPEINGTFQIISERITRSGYQSAMEDLRFAGITHEEIVFVPVEESRRLTYNNIYKITLCFHDRAAGTDPFWILESVEKYDNYYYTESEIRFKQKKYEYIRELEQKIHELSRELHLEK